VCSAHASAAIAGGQVTNSDTSQNGSSDVLTEVQRDHREIEQMIQQVDIARGESRQRTFEELVRKLAVHETAEEEVVHPLAKKVGAESVADEILNEESQAKTALSKLDGIDVSTPDFDAAFQKIKSDVLAHAQHEEREEHPKIAASTPPEELERLGKVFAVAERTAPTHPHANAPESRAGNLMLGPILAVTDRVKDAIRSARDKD
jgi:hemerythrin superfamily protein